MIGPTLATQKRGLAMLAGENAGVVDHSVDKADSWLMSSPNRLKLGVFGFNLSGGMSPITMADGPPQLRSWDEQEAAARTIDKAGLEAIIPVAKWKGVPGPSRFWDRTYETFTWAAGLAAVTERTHIMVTAHIPVYHPVTAAKMVATVDHIAGGRIGLNTVTGIWEPEFAQFGMNALLDHDKRYEIADEWIEIVKRLWTDDDEFDHDTSYFEFKGAYSSPKPVQRPYPVLMSAGWSPAGQAFACKNSDLLFINLGWAADEAPGKIAAVKEKLDATGRDIGLWAMAHVVCRDSERAARDVIKAYADDRGDWETAAALLDNVSRTSRSMPGVHESMQASRESDEALRANPALRNLVEHCGATPLIGTPERVVEQMAELADMGINGLALQFLDYGADLDQFVEQLLPEMVKAGLRVDPA
jgi:alkanesulfonate monooxygenase SsuD/methylene tetrahydromethanopterin reductase-like flavin-dependent oxidoreductase (luciferase family)